MRTSHLIWKSAAASVFWTGTLFGDPSFRDLTYDTSRKEFLRQWSSAEVDVTQNGFAHRISFRGQAPDSKTIRSGFLELCGLLSRASIDRGMYWDFNCENPVARIAEVVERASRLKNPEHERQFLRQLRQSRAYIHPQALATQIFARRLTRSKGAEEASAMRANLRRMRVFPTSQALMSLPNEWAWAVTDPKVLCAATRLTSRLRDLILTSDAGGGISGNLFQDTRDAFESCGVSKSDSVEFSLRLLGIVSTRGTSMCRTFEARWLRFPGPKTVWHLLDYRFSSRYLNAAGSAGGLSLYVLGLTSGLGFEAWYHAAAGATFVAEATGPVSDDIFRGPYLVNEANFGVFSGLSAISLLSTYLDAKCYEKGQRYYTLPPQVLSDANYTKMYHFYLAAYLARELVASGYGTRSAIDATYQLSVLYEAGAETLTNSKFELDQFAYRLESQKDLAFTYAGAVWGAHLNDDGTSARMDVDPAIRTWATVGRNGHAKLEDYFDLSGWFGQRGKRAAERADLLQSLRWLRPEIADEIEVSTQGDLGCSAEVRREASGNL